MHLLRTLAIIIALFSSFSLKAQYFELLGSTEQQIRDKLTKDYPIVQKNAFDHGSILTFENQDHTSKVTFYFSWKSCYMIKASAPVRFMPAYINIANRRYEKMGSNIWKHQNFELTITQFGDKVISTFAKTDTGTKI
jgi:hypothetical protein